MRGDRHTKAIGMDWRTAVTMEEENPFDPLSQLRTVQDPMVDLTEPADLYKRYFTMESWARTGKPTAPRDVPRVNTLPGAELNFTERPVHLQFTNALVTWLTSKQLYLCAKDIV